MVVYQCLIQFMIESLKYNIHTLLKGYPKISRMGRCKTALNLEVLKLHWKAMWG